MTSRNHIRGNKRGKKDERLKGGREREREEHAAEIAIGKIGVDRVARSKQIQNKLYIFKFDL
jgi:hypothetical protein